MHVELSSRESSIDPGLVMPAVFGSRFEISAMPPPQPAPNSPRLTNSLIQYNSVPRRPALHLHLPLTGLTIFPTTPQLRPSSLRVPTHRRPRRGSRLQRFIPAIGPPERGHKQPPAIPPRHGRRRAHHLLERQGRGSGKGRGSTPRTYAPRRLPLVQAIHRASSSTSDTSPAGRSAHREGFLPAAAADPPTSLTPLARLIRKWRLAPRHRPRRRLALPQEPSPVARQPPRGPSGRGGDVKQWWSPLTAVEGRARGARLLQGGVAHRAEEDVHLGLALVACEDAGENAEGCIGGQWESFRRLR